VVEAAVRLLQIWRVLFFVEHVCDLFGAVHRATRVLPQRVKRHILAEPVRLIRNHGRILGPIV